MSPIRLRWPTSPRSGRRNRLTTLSLESLEGRRLLSADARVHATAATAARSDARSTPHVAELAGGVRAMMNVTYLSQAGRQEHLDLYVPTGPAPAGGRPAILALPGGGWRWVRRSDLGAAVSQFAKDGYVVAVADYTYSSGAPGTHVWPTNFQDVQSAVRFLRQNAARYGIDSGRIAAWGESAGGNLAALLGTDPAGPIGATALRPTRGVPNPSVSAAVEAVVDFYGPADLTRLYGESATDRPYLNTFLGGTPSQVPDRYTDASPVTHVSPSSAPFLIFQGQDDTANVPDQSTELAAALKSAGVPVHLEIIPNTGHGFRLKGVGNQDLTPDVLAFLDDALNRQGQGIASLTASPSGQS
jgi:acetyl esterase/lipase